MKHLMNTKTEKLTRRGFAFLLALVLTTSAFVPGLTARATEGETPTLESLEPLKDYETAVALLADLDTIAQALPEDASEEDMKAVYDAIVTAQADAEALTDDVALTDDQKTEVADLSAAILTYLTEERGYVPAEPEAQNDEGEDEDEEDETPTCSCPEGTEGHIEGCLLYVAPCGTCGETGTHKADCATLCTCPEGTEGHVEGCTLYVAPCEVCGETDTHKADCATLCTCPEGTEGHLAECPLYICADCGLNNCICGLESAYLLDGAVIYKDYNNTEDTKTITGWNTAVKIQSSVTAEDGTVWYQFVYSNLLKELLNGYHYVKAADTTTLKCTCTEAPAADGKHQGDCPLAECNKEGHVHNAECTPILGLSEDDRAAVEGVIALIELLQTYDEITAKLDEFYEADDTEGEEAYLTEVYSKVEEAYRAYMALDESLREYVTNADNLMDLEFIWSRLTLEETTAPDYSFQPPINADIEVNLFNYGSNINDDEVRVLPFANASEPAARFRFLDGHGVYDNTYSYRPVMKRMLEGGYPYVISNPVSSGTDNNNTGSLAYLFTKGKDEYGTGNWTTVYAGEATADSHPRTPSTPNTSQRLTYENLRTGLARFDNATGYATGYRVMHEGMDGDGGLFQQDDNGYYVYDSKDNAAYFNGERFVLYNCLIGPGHHQDESSGNNWNNFFPFDMPGADYDSKSDATDNTYKEHTDNANKPTYILADGETTKVDERDSIVDTWYGMTVEFDFFMPKDGKLDGEEMIFDFSGDDDVWLYIDDVLVLDIGGSHGAKNGTVNFATGAVSYPRSRTGDNFDTDLRSLYTLAYMEKIGQAVSEQDLFTPENLTSKVNALDASEKQGLDTFLEANGFGPNSDSKTFEDYTAHRLNFYYMERGGNIGYCRLNFNIEPLPKGGAKVTKTLKEDTPITAITKNLEYTFKLVKVNGTNEEPLAGYAFSTNIDGRSGTTGSDGTFKLKADETAAFSDLTTKDDKGQIYRVYEVSSEQYHVDNVIYTGRPNNSNGVVQENGKVKYVQFTAMPKDAEEKIIHSSVFENILTTTDFTVTKKVTGNLGDRMRNFTFHAELYYDSTMTTKLTFPAGTGYEVNAENVAVFQLKHEDSITFENIPNGAYVKIVEVEEEYDTTIEGAESFADRVAFLTTDLTEDNDKVIFTNEKDVTIDTGISLDSIPYIVILVGVAAVVGFLFLRKRRVED